MNMITVTITRVAEFSFSPEEYNQFFDERKRAAQIAKEVDEGGGQLACLLLDVFGSDFDKRNNGEISDISCVVAKGTPS